MLVLKCGSVVWQRHSLGHAPLHVALATQVFGLRQQQHQHQFQERQQQKKQLEQRQRLPPPPPPRSPPPQPPGAKWAEFKKHAPACFVKLFFSFTKHAPACFVNSRIYETRSSVFRKLFNLRNTLERVS